MTPVEQFLQSAVNVLAALLPFVILPIIAVTGIWFKTRWEEFKLNQPDNIQRLIEDAAKFGADFAEKIDLSGIIEDYAHTKKDAALEAARSLLKEKGYEHVDLSVLDAAIEVILFRNPDKF